MQTYSASPHRSGGAVRSYEPAKIGPLTAERLRRLSVPREPVDIAPGWSLALGAEPDVGGWSENGLPVEIQIRIGGEAVFLRTVWPLLERLLHDSEPRVAVSDLDADIGAALIESHLQPAIESLEQIIGVRCEFVQIVAPSDHSDLSHLNLRLIPREGERGDPAILFATPLVLGKLALAWEQRPVLWQSRMSTGFLLAARVAYSTLSRGALRQLATGDALLFDRVAPEGGVAICMGETLYAQGEITEDGNVLLTTPLAKASPLTLGDFSMSDDNDQTDSGAAVLDEADVASLPVKLVFEVGRREITLEELRGLGVGAPIPLDRPATAAVDIIANGRRIGGGDVVLIGDQLGVRITRLNGHA